MGQSWTRIGRELGISKGGVGSLSKQVLVKLGARNSAQAVDIGHRLGLLGAEPDTDRGRLGAEPDLDLPQVLLDVLRLLVVGHTNAEIARLLGRSENTVIDQVLQIRRRLGARDRAHAAALAVAMRLVHLSLPTSAGVVANGA
jgi:DNA-binding NarL/FixJ family response regulator